MFRYSIKRIISILPTMFLISICMFSLMKMMPQDPVALSMPSYVKPAQYEIVYEQVKEDLGLNDTLIVQYCRWMRNTMQGDLGTSIMYKKPVVEVIAKPLFHTFLLNGIVLIIAFAISLFGGLHSALKVHQRADHIWSGISLLGMSIPSFFIALLLIYIFAFQLHLFPSSGMPLSTASIGEWFRYLCLPIASMVLLEVSGNLRYLRNSILEVLQSEYMVAAKARGLSKQRLWMHAIRNCMMPIITLWMSSISTLLMGSVLIENIFAYDGIGRVLLNALEHRDFMLAIALNFIYALLYVICNFIADLLYARYDARVQLR